MNFEYKALPWNIIFGADALSRLPQELDKLGYSRALVLVTPNQSEIGQEIVELLGDKAAGLFDQAMMHVPVETLEQAMAEVKRFDADCSVSVGGGSTTGLSKALAYHLDLPNIVVPTSYAGSEMTNVWAVTQDNRKVTRRDNIVVPTLTIYDPELTLTLPPAFAAASGMNAMAQAVANAAAEDANPVSSVMALEGIRTLARSLPAIISEPGNMDARTEALYGASPGCRRAGNRHDRPASSSVPHTRRHVQHSPCRDPYSSAAAQCRLQRRRQARHYAQGRRGLGSQRCRNRTV